MKKYILPIILIVLGGFGFWYGKSIGGAGINPIKAIITYSGILLIIIGVIIGGVKLSK